MQPSSPDDVAPLSLPEKPLPKRQIQPSQLLKCCLDKTETAIKLSAEVLPDLDPFSHWAKTLDSIQMQSVRSVHTRVPSQDVSGLQILGQPRDSV